MWTLCLRVCCFDPNDKDEKPLLACRRLSDCSHQVHDPDCVKSWTSSRNLGREQTFNARLAKSSVGNIAVCSKTSKNLKTKPCEKIKGEVPKLQPEKRNAYKRENRSNWWKKEDNRYKNYTQCRENYIIKMDKSTGAKKTHRENFRTDCKNKTTSSEAERLDVLEMGDAQRFKSRRNDVEPLARTRRGMETDGNADSYCRHYEVQAWKEMPGTPHCQAREKSPFSSALNRCPEGGYDAGCSGDSDFSQGFVERRAQKMACGKRRYPLSKSDGQAGTWCDDQVDSIPITVSLSDICKEVSDPSGLNASLGDDPVACFRLEMGNPEVSSALESPRQQGPNCKPASPENLTQVLQTDRATNSPFHLPLENPENSSVILFDELSFGVVHFSVSYYKPTKRLFVHIKSVENMPPKENNYFYSVMLQLTILPTGKQTKNSATVKSPDMNPCFHEDFAFIVKEPSDKVLTISAYDADLHGKYNALGHAVFHLSSLSDEVVMCSYSLLREPWLDSWPGRLRVTLKYEPPTKSLSVTVHCAEGLSVVTRGPRGSSQSVHPERFNTYAKLTQYCAGIKLKVKRTITVINSRDPYYSGTFEFNLSSKISQENFIVISVRLKSLMKESELGRVIFGPLHFASGFMHTPWGLAVSENQTVTSWYKMYI